MYSIIITSIVPLLNDRTANSKPLKISPRPQDLFEGAKGPSTVSYLINAMNVMPILATCDHSAVKHNANE